MKYVIILAVAAVAIASFAYFLLFSAPDNAKDVTTNDFNKEVALEVKTADKSFSGKGTLEELILRNEDVECTITYAPGTIENESEVKGTFFTSQGSMRGDFLIKSPDLRSEILSSIIINDQIMYAWSEIDGGLYGMKLDTSLFDESQIESSEPVSLDDEITYQCKFWQNVDRSVFIPPSDVLFQDLSQLMESGMEYGTVYEEGEF